MLLTPLLLLGAGGHARVCIDVIEEQGLFRVGGLIGMPHEVGNSLLGYEVTGTDSELPTLLRYFSFAHIGVGQIKTAEPRVRLFETAVQHGYAFPTLVSPRAYVSRHAEVGEGTLVMPGAIINAGAKVGRNCIINSHALVEHDCTVEDHCHIATAATLNSAVHVGSRAFVGSNSTVRQGLRIGAGCLVGMGQVVLADCQDGTQLPPRKSMR